MGIDKYFYLGPYIRVWLDKVSYADTITTCSSKTCTEHGKYLVSNFCGVCGSLIQECQIKREHDDSILDFFEEHFGDIDFFREERLSNLPYTLILPNRDPQGGQFIYEDGEYFLPEDDLFKHDDWQCLITKLKEKNIKFEQKAGAIYWEA